MTAWWLKFKDKAPGCVEAKTEEEARLIACEVCKSEPISCDRLPYPANPRLNKFVHEKFGVHPSFCWKPDECAGRNCCPRPYSCSE